MEIEIKLHSVLLCFHKGSHKVCLRSRDLGEEAASGLVAVLSCTPFCHLKSKKENKAKDCFQFKTLLSIQASALGTITVRVVMRTVVSECGEMVLSQSVFKKRKTTPFLFGNMD